MTYPTPHGAKPSQYFNLPNYLLSSLMTKTCRCERRAVFDERVSVYKTETLAAEFAKYGIEAAIAAFRKR
jgi:hypothetical protein